MMYGGEAMEAFFTNTNDELEIKERSSYYEDLWQVHQISRYYVIVVYFVWIF